VPGRPGWEWAAAGYPVLRWAPVRHGLPYDTAAARFPGGHPVLLREGGKSGGQKEDVDFIR